MIFIYIYIYAGTTKGYQRFNLKHNCHHLPSAPQSVHEVFQGQLMYCIELPGQLAASCDSLCIPTGRVVAEPGCDNGKVTEGLLMKASPKMFADVEPCFTMCPRNIAQNCSQTFGPSCKQEAGSDESNHRLASCKGCCAIDCTR